MQKIRLGWINEAGKYRVNLSNTVHVTKKFLLVEHHKRHPNIRKIFVRHHTQRPTNSERVDWIHSKTRLKSAVTIEIEAEIHTQRKHTYFGKPSISSILDILSIIISLQLAHALLRLQNTIHMQACIIVANENTIIYNRLKTTECS